jgi:putative mycofactocin binding protein MftB
MTSQTEQGRSPAAGSTPGAGFDLDAAWAVHPQVSVRPEPFGALLYHFGTRRLSFLKDPTLRVVVESLAAHPDARSALAAAGVPVEESSGAPPAVTAAPVAGSTTASIIRSLSTLAATGMIVER